MAKKSDWYLAEKAKRPQTRPCSACGGTGSTGQTDSKGRTIVCPACGGFGY